MSRPSACRTSAGRIVRSRPFSKRLTTTRTSSRSRSWACDQVELAPGAVEAGDAEFGDQQDEVRLGEQRQRPVGPVGSASRRTPCRTRASQARRSRSAARSKALPAASSRRRGDDVAGRSDARPWWRAAGRRRAARRPRAGRPATARPQAELEGGIAELDVEVDQAGLAPALRLVLRETGSRAG